jgi:hypothetical protein
MAKSNTNRSILFGGHPRTDLVAEHVKAFRYQPAGLAHGFESGGAVELDLAGLALRRQCRVDITHQGIAAGAASSRLPGCRCCTAM